MRAIIRGLAVALAAVLTFGLGAFAQSLTETQPALEPGDGYLVMGGPVRLGPNLYIHANSAHAAPGLKSMTVVSRYAKAASTRCDLIIELDSKPGDKVISISASPDESLAQLGVSAGASGGSGRILLRFFKDGKKICPQDRMFGSRSNVWLEVTSTRNSEAPVTITPSTTPVAPPVPEPTVTP